jgi:hypothetical protein
MYKNGINRNKPLGILSGLAEVCPSPKRSVLYSADLLEIGHWDEFKRKKAFGEIVFKSADVISDR